MKSIFLAYLDPILEIWEFFFTDDPDSQCCEVTPKKAAYCLALAKFSGVGASARRQHVVASPTPLISVIFST
jgi:hypothetical protein